MDIKNSLPQFPEFIKLDISHKQLIDSYSSNFRPYSDYNFTSMLCYDVDEIMEISILNGNLIVKFSDYLDGSPFYSFLGKNQIMDTIEMLLDYSIKNLGKNYLGLIGEEIVQADMDIFSYFQVSENRDQFDYILNLDLLANLNGKAFKSKRQLLSRFMRNHPNSEFRTIDLSLTQIQTEILYLVFKWAHFGTEFQKEFDHELSAIRKFIKYNEHFDFYCTGLFDNNRLIAFSLNELIDKPYSICHFMKADPSYSSSFNALDNFSAKELIKKGYTYLNIEQDLGLEGLRNSKMSLRPEFLLKKYTISRKEKI